MLMINKSQLKKRLKTKLHQRSYHTIQSHLKTSFSVFVLIILGIVLSSVQPTYVTAQIRAISLAIPETTVTLFQDTILPGFHDLYPDIYVDLVPISDELIEELQLPTTIGENQDYLEAAEQLVSSADVHFIFPDLIGSESTRAGYFLDIQPLVSADDPVQADDLVPSMRDAFSWDGGQWALPVMATPIVIVYDPDRFDEIGLGYPDELWVFDDFMQAAQLLADETSPGMQVTSIDIPTFFHILTGQDYTDGNFPPGPLFDTPVLEAAIEMWATLEADGIVTSGFAEDVPLRFGRINQLSDRVLQGSLLQGKAGADIYAVAISSGTNDPELAYQLATYLTTVPNITELIPGSIPVRYSVQDQILNQQTFPETAFLLNKLALENAVTTADIQFGHYLHDIVPLVASGESAESVLQSTQIVADNNLVFATTLRETVQVVVPITEFPMISEGRVVNFALFTGSSQLSNRRQWQSFIDTFVAENNIIDDVILNVILPTQGYWDEIPNNDCVFGYDFTFYPEDILLPLDPLLNADSTFDPEDVVGDVMLEMQNGQTTYGIPIAVTPLVLRYDPEIFSQAGIVMPDGTWTVNKFINDLLQLQTITEDPPLFLHSNISTLWEILMAGYGAAPVNYLTIPPTLLFTDQDVVSTIREVLDLAKSGLIYYQPMATFFGYSETPSYSPAIQTTEFSGLWDIPDNYGFVTYPNGTNTPISFRVKHGFIFAHTLHPEGCYQLLREITRHPELFESMPAYHSVINDPVTQVIYGETGVGTFLRFSYMMEASDRVFVRMSGLDIGERMFMGRAFDRYVLEDLDIEEELRLAQDLIVAYRTCMENNDQDTIGCLLEADPAIRENIPSHVLGDR